MADGRASHDLRSAVITGEMVCRRHCASDLHTHHLLEKPPSTGLWCPSEQGLAR